MRAYHWLRDDMTSGGGNEPPWTVGETRTIEGDLALCERGYHWSPTLWDGLCYAPGSMACLVEVSDPVATDDTPNQRKGISRSRTLLAAVNVERELRLFACDCAERVLLHEREQGRKPGQRSWQAIAVSRRFAVGEANAEQLTAARYAAWDAAGYAAWNAAWYAAGYAARYAAWDAARDAAWYAAWDAAGYAERAWQRQRFDELVVAKLAAVEASP
jgi:hypothetical protein